MKRLSKLGSTVALCALLLPTLANSQERSLDHLRYYQDVQRTQSTERTQRAEHIQRQLFLIITAGVIIGMLRGQMSEKERPYRTTTISDCFC